MKKVLLIVISMTLLSGCGMMSNQAPEDTMGTASGNQKMSMDTSGYETSLSSASMKIKESEEFQGCMKLNTNMCIQNAGNQLAQKSKDPAFCRELKDTNQQASCEFAVTMINATEKNDIKLCDTLSDANFKKQCQIQIYRQDAIVKKDIKLCNKLSIAEAPTASGGPVDINASMQKDQCILQIIMSDADSTEKDCSTITNTGSSEMCKVMIKNKPSTIPPAPVGASPPAIVGPPAPATPLPAAPIR